VRITRQLTAARGQAPFFAPPKTAACWRRVILPGSILAEVQGHLDNYTGAAADALLFTSRAAGCSGTAISGVSPGFRR